MGQHDTAPLERSARGGADDRVHLVDAGLDALLDPSPYRTRCGQDVLEVYNTRLAATCSSCRRHAPDPSVSPGPATTTADLRTAELGTVIGHDPGRLAATIMALVFVAAGTLGFVPGATSDYTLLDVSGPSSGATLFGVFAVSIVRNAMYLALGLAGLAMARTVGRARAFLVSCGLVCLVLCLYGVIVNQYQVANVIPLNTADNWLHLVLAVVLLGLGYLVGTPPRSTNTPMH